MMSYMYRLLSTLVERLFYYISFVIFCLALFKLISKVILFPLELHLSLCQIFLHNHLLHHLHYIVLSNQAICHLLYVLCILLCLLLLLLQFRQLLYLLFLQNRLHFYLFLYRLSLLAICHLLYVLCI